MNEWFMGLGEPLVFGAGSATPFYSTVVLPQPQMIFVSAELAAELEGELFSGGITWVSDALDEATSEPVVTRAITGEIDLVASNTPGVTTTRYHVKRKRREEFRSPFPEMR